MSKKKKECIRTKKKIDKGLNLSTTYKTDFFK